MSTPRVSVLMPVFNAERFLPAAVESILGQTMGDFEFLVIDDGSTDGSRPMLERYAGRDPRISLVSRPNAELLAALNEMLMRAKAGLLARMDADDIAMPQRLTRQTAYMDERPDCVALGCRVLLIDQDGAPMCETKGPTEHEGIDAEHLGGAAGSAIVHPSAVIRADAMRRLGGYRAERAPAEDLDLFLRLAEVGRLANLPECLLRYRIHLGSVGHTRRARQIEAARVSIEDARRRRGLPPLATPPSADDGTIDRASEHCKWAWWSLSGGHPSTARKHALRAVGRAPLRPACWKALACAIRGH